MSKAKLQEEMQQSLNAFFKGRVTVFEAGTDEQRPDYIQQRPFFKVLEQEQTSYIQQLKNASNDKKTYTVTTGKPDSESTLNTKSSELFQEMEQRFRNVRPNMTLFVIDPDLIRGRYLMDEAPDRSLGKSIIGFLKEKLEKEDKENAHPIEMDDKGMFEQAAFTGSGAFSASLPLGVTKKDIKGDKTVSIVVGDNPDVLEDEMFFPVPGVKERIEKEGVTHEDLKRFTFYHEFGHALDLANKDGHVPHVADTESMKQVARHETECIADAHAVLQLARDNGNTIAGELISDVRIGTIRGLIDQLNPANKSFSRLGKKIDNLKNQNMAPVKNEGENSKSLRDYEKTGKDFARMERIFAYIAYHTTPVADAAVEFAKKGLRDGSLQKMTDLEVLGVAKKLVDEHAFTQEKMSAFCLALVNEERTQDILDIVKRDDEGRARMPVDKEVIDKKYAKNEKKAKKAAENKLRESLGIPVKKEEKDKDKPLTKKAIKQTKAFAKWHKGVIEKVEKKGGDKKALLDVIAKEQDAIRLRGKKDPLGEKKLNAINNGFIVNAEAIVDSIKISNVVKKSIEAVEAPKTTSVGAKAIAEYIDSSLISFEAAEKGLDKATSRDVSSMTIIENQKAIQEEIIDYETVLKSERKTQVLAFKIRKDPKAWEIAKKSPELAENITDKAKKRHPEWIEDYHSNFGNNDKKRVNNIKVAVSEEKNGIAVAVLKTEAIKEALDTALLRELKQIKAKKTQETDNLNKAMLDKKSKGR